MKGLLALLGSVEYAANGHELDRQLLSATQCRQPRVIGIPGTAGKIGPHSLSQFAQAMRERFEPLDAQVTVAPITDRVAAYDPHSIALLRSADLIYLHGLHPAHFRRTFADTPLWTAIMERWQNGALLASSVVAETIMLAPLNSTRLRHHKIVAALGWVPDICLWPHFNRTLTKRGLAFLTDHLTATGTCAVGINDNTALVGRLGESWQVLGTESVSMITPETTLSYASGQRLTFPSDHPQGRAGRCND